MNRASSESYTLGSGVAATLPVSYAYGDNQPTGCNLIGRLMTVTATVSGGNNASNYLCYDWAGRPTSSSQMTAGVTHG
jgi:hypothetical protein